MADDHLFSDLVRRVRSGDPAGTTELVRLYEPAIRTVVRSRLTDPAMRRLFPRRRWTRQPKPPPSPSCGNGQWLA